MRPTRRALLVAAVSACATVAGWLLGLPEVSILAATGFALLAVAAATVLLRRPRLRVSRVAHPQRLQAGAACEIRLRIDNAGRTASPVLELRDQVSRFGTAELMVAPIAPGATSSASYSLPTRRRGRHHIGPLVVMLSDPFGLVRREHRHEDVLTVVITPRTWRLAALPPVPGDEPDHGTRALTSASTVDEEFASLRDYVTGDDIRRIHWRSTARRGSPVVREFDVPWQRRTTVVADLRTDRHDDASFERLVSVLASVVDLCAARDELVRLVTDASPASAYLPAADHVDDLLEELAVIVPSNGRVPPSQLIRTSAGSAGEASGRLVTVVGGLRAEERAELDRTGRRAGLHVVVGTHGGLPADELPASIVLNWDGTAELDELWGRALGRGVGARARPGAPVSR